MYRMLLLFSLPCSCKSFRLVFVVVVAAAAAAAGIFVKYLLFFFLVVIFYLFFILFYLNLMFAYIMIVGVCDVL